MLRELTSQSETFPYFFLNEKALFRLIWRYVLIITQRWSDSWCDQSDGSNLSRRMKEVFHNKLLTVDHEKKIKKLSTTVLPGGSKRGGGRQSSRKDFFFFFFRMQRPTRCDEWWLAS